MKMNLVKCSMCDTGFKSRLGQKDCPGCREQPQDEWSQYGQNDNCKIYKARPFGANH